MNLVVLVLLISGVVINFCLADQLSNYEYYTSGGIKSGLRTDSEYFTLNGKQITLFSGSLHYFRLPQQYWRDRLMKFRASGLNTVQIYAPWNLHEETPGNFDFETGFLNLGEFLRTAKEVDMFVYFRIGPYICAEWEMGGFPSWLLRDPQMRLRSNYKPYLNAIGKYFTKVLSVISDYQFTKGGPIIALQIENEYGGIHNQNDLEYFEFLRDTVVKSGFKELLSTCDGGTTAAQAVKTNLKDVLETVNFNQNAVENLKALRESQPNKPLHVTEFWPGWFDQWGEQTHHRMAIDYFQKEVTDILFTSNSSINFYMFFGGTNFGFTNGGHVVTSYDYNAPLSESGNYSDKYWKTKELFEKLVKERGLPKIHTPDPPEVSPTANYGIIKIKDYLSFEDLLTQIKPIESNKPKYMELLDIGPNCGQTFGFILYRIATQKFKNLKIKGGVSDRAVILIDDKEVDVVYNKDYQLNTSDSQFANTTEHKVDILVENTGRANSGEEMNTARKGLNGNVVIEDKNTEKYSIYPLDFKQKFVESLKTLKGRPLEKTSSPSLFRAELNISDKPKDTFLRLDDWKKGNVFVNGFNVGRYNSVGPQKTLYIPAPLLKSGINYIFVFELHSGTNRIEFLDKPDLGK